MIITRRRLLDELSRLVDRPYSVSIIASFFFFPQDYLLAKRGVCVCVYVWVDVVVSYLGSIFSCVGLDKLFNSLSTRFKARHNALRPYGFPNGISFQC